MNNSDASTTVIFGATGGVGSSLARRLADRHLSMLLVGRDPERLEALGNELGAPWRSLDARDAQAVPLRGGVIMARMQLTRRPILDRVAA